MSRSTAPERQLAAIEKFGIALQTGTSFQQLKAAREIDETTCCIIDTGLGARQAALLFEAHAFLATLDMRTSDAEELATQAADRWRDAGEHADELALRMGVVNAQIGELRDATLEVVPLVEKLEHLLTALGAAEPPRRRLIAGMLATGFGQLRIGRYDAARTHFSRAQAICEDDSERARALGASALCELQSGNEQRAIELAERSASLARSTYDRLQLAIMLRMLTGIYGEKPDELTRALELAEETVDAAEELGDVTLAPGVRLRGLLRVAAGQHAEAVVDLERSIRLLRGSAWQHTLPQEVLTLAQVSLASDGPPAAWRVVKEYAVLLDRADGDQRIEIDLFRYAAATAVSQPAAAARFAESTARLMAESHHKDAADIYERAAGAYLQAGDEVGELRCQTLARQVRSR